MPSLRSVANAAMWWVRGPPADATDNPSHGHARVLFIGDSITQGVSKGIEGHPPQGTSSYRRQLYFSLRASVPLTTTIDFVGPNTESYKGEPPVKDFPLRHAGYSGHAAFDLYARAKGFVTSSGYPDVVCVFLGANDFYQSCREVSHADAVAKKCVGTPMAGEALVDEAVQRAAAAGKPFTGNSTQLLLVKFAFSNLLRVVREVVTAFAETAGHYRRYTLKKRQLVMCRLLPHGLEDNSMALFHLFNAALELLFEGAETGEHVERIRHVLLLPSDFDLSGLVRFRLARTDKGIQPHEHLYDKVHPNSKGEVIVASNLLPVIRDAIMLPY